MCFTNYFITSNIRFILLFMHLNVTFEIFEFKPSRRQEKIIKNLKTEFGCDVRSNRMGYISKHHWHGEFRCKFIIYLRIDNFYNKKTYIRLQL